LIAGMWLIRSPNYWPILLSSEKMIFLKLSTLMGVCRCATGKILPPMPFFHPIRRFLSQDFGPGAQTAGGALSFLPQPYFSSPLDI
jgi:hypothetical protein